VYEKKYGIHDYRGGGRSSARETASRVVGGAVAKQIIPQIKITAFVSSVGEVSIDKTYQELDFSLIESNMVRCPDPVVAEKMEALIAATKKEGDTIGGTITCVIQNVPLGLGEPVFDKLHAELGKAMLSINAVKGFELGSGFCGAMMKGSQHNDLYNPDGSTQTNRSGGIQGGISNGMDIYFRVAFKPVATLLQKQDVLTHEGTIVEQQGKGRHDPCVVPRAVPIVEAMAALVLADNYLVHKTSKL
jgi:chorismate synthase